MVRGFLLLALLISQAVAAVDFDIVYVRQPRMGDAINTAWPEVWNPGRIDAGADLMLLHPDGSEEVLVDCTVCSVTDPFISFDGQSVYYSLFPDAEDVNTQRDLPRHGADIYKMHIATRQITRLTFGEFTPNTGAGNWDESNPLDPPDQYNRLGYGILNLGPMPLPGGKLAFTSNRNGYTPPKTHTRPTLQMFVMDENGDNVEDIAPMVINGALHPTVLRDGRLMFSSYESQGLRDARLWGIWTINPDGRNWDPLVSAFRSPQSLHFMTQLSGGDIVLLDYYNLNTNGFGTLYRMPLDPPRGEPRFHGAFPADNPPIDRVTASGLDYPAKMAFTPKGLYSITPFTNGDDEAAPLGDDGQTRVGKFTHPSAAPEGDLLVVWSPGPANNLMRPTNVPRVDAGLYVIPDGATVNGPDELVLIKNDPNYNEAWPRAVVAYSDIYGVAEPAELPWLPNDGSEHAELPEGTPFGLVGASSFYHRESFPGQVKSWANTFDGLDAFNTSENQQSSNWVWQGADAGKYENSDIWAVRIVAMEPNTHRSYGPNIGRHYHNAANERLRIIGEIPLRKTDGGQTVNDPHGNPDTSFLAKVPADTPLTFQTLDRNGMVLNMAQTWHQVRPGEVRTNCGGCHAHSLQPLAFSQTAAGQPGFEPVDLVDTTPLITHDGSGSPDVREVAGGVADVEFLRDIRPILQSRCVSCHTQGSANPPGNLVLDDTALVDGLPGDYVRLADDREARWGYAPVISNGRWRQTNVSRYVRPFQSRRSLLVWKIFGERLDGWTNADHPTESTPGDAGTLPNGANPNDADLDFTGDIMPPPGSGVAPLTIDEKMLFARWIDMGAPIDTAAINGNNGFGWFLDDLRPTVTVSSPRPGVNDRPVTSIRYGLADANSGVDMSTLSVSATFNVAGRAPRSELRDLAVEVADGVYEIGLGAALPAMGRGVVNVSVADIQGNVKRVTQVFTTDPDLVFTNDFE